MKMNIRAENGRQIVEISGRLDSVTSGELEKKGLELVAGGAVKMVMDLAETDYISSAGLRTLLTLAKAARAKGGSLALCRPKSDVRHVITLSGFEQILTVHPDLAGALA